MNSNYETKNDFVFLNEVIKDNLSEMGWTPNRLAGTIGISTGFKGLDDLSGGLMPGELILVGGRPSMGKTSFALNVAKTVSACPTESVAYFSLEMSKRQLTNRIISSEAQVSITEASRNGMSNEEWTDIISAADKASKLNILIDDTPGISASDIYDKCRSLQKKYGLSMVIVDYLQLVTCNDQKGTRREEVAEISRTLKALARDLNVPVIVLSQLSRAIDQRVDHHPLLSDLRESGAIEQDADMIIFLYREKHYHKESSKGDLTEIIVSKHIDGKCGRVELLWDPSNMTFNEIS